MKSKKILGRLSRLLMFTTALLPMSTGIAAVPLKRWPCAAGTWGFSKLGLDVCAPMLESGCSAIDAVEAAVRTVELDNQDQYYVGVGGYPNAEGKMELDAAIMDGDCRYGAVLSLSNIATPISVARSVMEKCPHNVLVGDGALKWARSMGFEEKDTLTEPIKKEWEEWVAERETAGPTSVALTEDRDREAGEHDTVGVICIDKEGKMAAGTSTSGWRFKHPGRVGDSPLVGSGLYCDGEVGAAVATGDGEEIMRTCACFVAVEYMRHGMDVQEACARAIQRIVGLKKAPTADRMHTSLVVGIVAMDKNGKVGAASSLDEANQHRDRPYFPVSVWREAAGCAMLHASTSGASM